MSTTSKGVKSRRGEPTEDEHQAKWSDEENQDGNNVSVKRRANKRVRLEKKDAQKSTEGEDESAQPVHPICEICFQELNQDLRLYVGHPQDAVDECAILLDPTLCLFHGNEVDVAEEDARALNKVTGFCVYDKNKHLCPFDGGLIEGNIDIYFSGHVKPIYEENAMIQSGIPGKDLGPIVAWWIGGFEGGEEPILYLSTEIGDYILMEPSAEYAPLMTSVREKSIVGKIIVEFLLDEENLSYEDLLNKLQTVAMPEGLPKFTEDILLYHAQFICDQILSFDESATSEDPLLITAPCIRALINLAGITFSGGKTVGRGRKRNNARQQEDERRKGLMRRAHKEKRGTLTKATTTRLVNQVFEDFFPEQLDNSKDSTTSKRRRCGACKNCQNRECGECGPCKNMKKFGGSGRDKLACVKRRCLTMEIQAADDQDPDDDRDATVNAGAEPSLMAHKKMIGTFESRSGKTEWLGEQIGINSNGSFYRAVQLDSGVISVNDHVLVELTDSTVPNQIVKVISMWANKVGTKMFHAAWLWRGSETVLGETSSSGELFLVDDCRGVPICSIKSKTKVVRRFPPKNWAELGNVNVDSSVDDSREDTTSFYYQKRYDPNTARFEDPAPEVDCMAEDEFSYCAACERSSESEHTYNRPRVLEELEERSSKGVLFGLVKCRGEEFRVGSAVYLRPKTFKFKNPPPHQNAARILKQQVDEDRFPEYYRKHSDRIKGSNSDTPEPFDIGYITSIYANTNVKLLAAANLQIGVKRMYRPENTRESEGLKQRSDVNLIYWSEKELSVPFTAVAGKCYLAYSKNIDDIEAWSSAGPNRFYFTEMYVNKDKVFDDPPPMACGIGKATKVSDTQHLKSNQIKFSTKPLEIPPGYPPISRKLCTLNVFAGCGGLSEGLKQAGVSESKWAIEVDESAAHAYRLNNPDAVVFNEDCNVVLKKVMDGDTVMGGQRLPQKGQVDLLCGGPPCQGFSGMNRFNSGAYSQFKNSLVVSYLSYCDYYRPRFFIMENVRNFVMFKKGLVLKLTLRCLIGMGYQCTFGLFKQETLESPRRAEAPGETLPKYPNPLHVFSKSACSLGVVIDDKKYLPAYDWSDSAPYRAITVRDALSDLPSIKNGSSNVVMTYGGDPTSYFQRKVRSGVDENSLLDHVCKDLGALIEARMAHIPTTGGSDWRDLPNIVVPLSDGTHCKKLKYRYHDNKAGKGSNEALRGVCTCAASGKDCNPLDKQDNTLIPWCLPHTANRHNNWAGLYGRIEWNGFFSTTTTNPEPMSKQGRVLHPEQTRVVSVWECARSQGFSDNFRFHGTILNKHRQVGNAVPPPLAAAIGLEIRKCLSEAELKRMNS